LATCIMYAPEFKNGGRQSTLFFVLIVRCCILLTVLYSRLFMVQYFVLWYNRTLNILKIRLGSQDYSENVSLVSRVCWRVVSDFVAGSCFASFPRALNVSFLYEWKWQEKKSRGSIDASQFRCKYFRCFSLQKINHDRARPPSCCLANTFFIDHVDVVCCSPHFYEKERQELEIFWMLSLKAYAVVIYAV
jgi:hypothetical protein